MTKSIVSKIIASFLFFTIWHTGFSQSKPSSEIYHQLLQLKETRRVLYMAAHPDDENTRLIAYLANGENLQVAYLSLTRGDGGQNLIGKELGVKLGQIRTQELLQARKTDGGRQYFSTAIDFGYTKTPDETFQNWDKTKLLSDVVWVIRNFQPDIIITRFNTIPGGGNHGQHTTSAIMAEEALKVADDPNVFPEQLKYVKPWKVKRVFWNTYNFRGDFEKEKGQKYFEFNSGEYNPLIGESYSKIAADSRTMHKSQGFGSTARPGEAIEHIQLVAGEPAESSPFDGVQNRWETIPGGEEIEDAIDQLISNFDFVKPESNVQGLLEIKSKLDGLNSDEVWVQEKQDLIDNLILESLGVETEWTLQEELGYPGQEIATDVMISNPTNGDLEVVSFTALGKKEELNTAIQRNQLQLLERSFVLPSGVPLSQPYWLQESITGAMYEVKNQLDIGKAFDDRQLSGTLVLNYKGQQLVRELPLTYKVNSRIDGEVNQPFTVVPEVDLVLSKENVFLVDGADQSLTVSVNFSKEIIAGELKFENLEPSQYRILSTEENSAQNQLVFEVAFSLDSNEKRTVVANYLTNSGDVYDQSTNRILYSHIPNLTYFSPASVNLIQADWQISGAKVGYIPGAGDDVPGVLSSLGYQVTEISSNDYSLDYLNQFKAIIVGIRAYNTNEVMVANNQVLMDYVKAGGNLVVQYNTTAGLLTDNIGPYPFELSRDRVTVENSPFKADWDHPALSTPNQLVAADFDDWVQERGLYFVSDISKEYSTPLQFQDPGEEFMNGNLIYAEYGEGHYVYTGLSFFRELPAGVPGAIKLFINLIEQ
ncbi:PIG-L family deacetylase [Algoriphagus machipongonensis]|uniref:Lipoprotein n=1 Tax=Algoriphagus machipongonensis TaxID=388413 RepID=A3HTG2_9BACT|nr:PIG-L family deacetylase [Algoriphagus machipongonensis]EAZ83130.1 lipoprotein [Algoriphagus machipongonensis]